MQSALEIHAPRLIRVGGGCVADIGSILGQFGLSRPLVVSDPFLVASGMIERCLEPLHQAGIETVVFSDTVPDPTDTVVRAGVAVLKAGQFDCLIGFGGGSPMDTAKAIAILAAGGQHLRDWKAPALANIQALPLICVPTTAGTGSEVTRFTVITDTETEEKMLIAGRAALPLAAIVDWKLARNLPARTTADTGIDSLTHALEAFVSRRANPYSDAQARAALALIAPNLRSVYHDGSNNNAREAVMLGATLAGLAFSNASVALVHGMSRPIGAHFHVPHGLSNAMLLPTVTRFSLQLALPRYAEAARIMGVAQLTDSDSVAGAALLAELQALNVDLEVPRLRGWGISPSKWDGLLETMAEQALASGSPANNPRIPDKAEIVALYREAWAA